jgi:hypothetical protein
MASYQTANFNLKTQSVAGRKSWVYEDTGPLSDVVAAGFVTDGANKGCDSGDFVEYIDTSRRIVYGLHVAAGMTDTGATQVTLDGSVILADTS